MIIAAATSVAAKQGGRRVCVDGSRACTDHAVLHRQNAHQTTNCMTKSVSTRPRTPHFEKKKKEGRRSCDSSLFFSFPISFSQTRGFGSVSCFISLHVFCAFSFFCGGASDIRKETSEENVESDGQWPPEAVRAKGTGTMRGNRSLFGVLGLSPFFFFFAHQRQTVPSLLRAKARKRRAPFFSPFRVAISSFLFFFRIYSRKFFAVERQSRKERYQNTGSSVTRFFFSCRRRRRRRRRRPR